MSSSLKTWVNLNGQVMEGERATISVFDRGFLYGDSVYEVTQTLDGVPFMLEDHLDRLAQSASKIGLQLGWSRHDLKIELARTLAPLKTPQAYIRYIVTRGEGEIGLDPKLATRPNLVIIAKELKAYPAEWYQKGVHVIVAGTRRNPTESIDPNVKSGNYLNNVMAYAEATRLGAFDAIMLNHRDEVTEATTSNVWAVLDGMLLTPPLSSGLLEGITRKHLIQVVREQELPFEMRTLTRDDLNRAEEIFLTSTTKRLVPVTQLDQLKVGTGAPGKITQVLRNAYDQHVDSLHAEAAREWKLIQEQANSSKS